MTKLSSLISGIIFGLGLTICKKIVEAHSGQLLMSSNDDKTTFSIEIPIKKQ